MAKKAAKKKATKKKATKKKATKKKATKKKVAKKKEEGRKEALTRSANGSWDGKREHPNFFDFSGPIGPKDAVGGAEAGTPAHQAVAA